MDVNITGAKILFELPFGIQITETQVNMWIVMIVLAIVCKWLTHNLKVKPTGKRQLVAETLVTMANNFVVNNAGKKFQKLAPFIAALFSLSLSCSLLGLLGMYSPTADLNTTLGWAILVFIMITYYKIKSNGVKGYLKGFMEPISIMLPINIIGEFATPISMALRMFGNAAIGGVISTLLYAALAFGSAALLGGLPDLISNIPLLQLGIPAVLSIYFDVISSVLQSFIFCMLTILYISLAAGEEN